MAGPEQIVDRILNFTRSKVLKGKLYREANLTVTKSQEIANIIDEPEVVVNGWYKRKSQNSLCKAH